MALFSKKKEKKEELPPLKFPNFPEDNFPTYESEIAEETDIEPEELEEISRELKQREEPEMRRFEPEIRPEIEERVERQRTEKALFVKVDRYKKALTIMDIIKEKLQEAERAIAKLEELKKREDDEMQRWKQDLEELKAKLLEIDKALFE